MGPGNGGGLPGAVVCGSEQMHCALYGTRTALGLSTSKSFVLLDIHDLRVHFLYHIPVGQYCFHPKIVLKSTCCIGRHFEV